MDKSPEPRFLVIGRVGKPRGVRGEVHVIPFTDLPERFTWVKQVFVGEIESRLIGVEYARIQDDRVHLKFAGYDTREAVAELRGQLLQVPEEEAIPLAEGEYFLFQLLGLRVYSDEGAYLGELRHVLETGANNVFVVQGDGPELLLPDIPEVILDINFEQKRMTVHVLAGLAP